MVKRLCDACWACLPKEARVNIRSSYKDICEDNEIAPKIFLEELFGSHNLTSDTEPEEMLMVERKKVQEVLDMHERAGNKITVMVIKALFGDKCLPDKENTPKSGELKLEHGLEQTSVKVSAKVDTEHYAEPETKSSNLSQSSSICDKSKDNQLKDNMEENLSNPTPLNLCELLKGCEGEWFYVTPCGEMELKSVYESEIKPIHFSRGTINCFAKTDGKIYEDGACIIYPSRALYEKYPLDAYSAWMEWAEARKPKRWRAHKNKCAYFITDEYEIDGIRDDYSDICNALYNSGNYFRTEELAQRAADGIREYLKAFHENNPK